MDNFNGALAYRFTARKSICGDFTHRVALRAVNSLTLEGDKIIHHIIGKVVQPWQELTLSGKILPSESFNTASSKHFKNFWADYLLRFINQKSKRLVFESYMVPERDLLDSRSSKFGGFRQADVRHPCFLCYGVKNEVLVSTADVMHR